MIRETVETLGPPGILIPEEQVLAQCGPDPIHEATAIVEALTKLLPKQNRATAKFKLGPGSRPVPTTGLPQTKKRERKRISSPRRLPHKIQGASLSRQLRRK
jgi:hypothetical protein